MPASEARILANKANSSKSTGPKTPEGKIRSRANGLKHGMTGSGVVIPGEDADEVELLEPRLLPGRASIPRRPSGAMMVVQLATLSVRMERGARQESATLATRARHAVDDFDEARFQEAEHLFQGLAESPRENLRKLRKSPKGVDRLLLAWNNLRNDLTRTFQPQWTEDLHLRMAANLTGLDAKDALCERLTALSCATWGFFSHLAVTDAADLDREARKTWARGKLVEWIDGEIAGLVAHRETLDFETIEQDRAEAGTRALFDPSREAALARRYEAEARRGFFKALKDFRQIEAEAAGRLAAEPTPEPTPELASSCDGPPTARRDPDPVLDDRPTTPLTPPRHPLSRSDKPVQGQERHSERVGKVVSGAV